MICRKCRAKVKPSEAFDKDQGTFVCPNCGAKGTIDFVEGETMYSEMARDPNWR